MTQYQPSTTPSATAIAVGTGLTRTDIDHELALWNGLLADPLKSVGYTDEEIAKECMQHALRNLT